MNTNTKTLRRRSFDLQDKLQMVEQVIAGVKTPTEIKDGEGVPVHPALIERWVNDYKVGALRGSNDLRTGNPNFAKPRVKPKVQAQPRANPWDSSKVSDSMKMKIAEMLLENDALRAQLNKLRGKGGA